MSSHLPECVLAPGACLTASTHQEADGFCRKCFSRCICDKLRACEERIRAEEREGESVRLIAAAENGARLAFRDAADYVRRLWPIHHSMTGESGEQFAAEIEALQPGTKR